MPPGCAARRVSPRCAWWPRRPAISLDNARLYRDLAEREAQIRRLVPANIIVWSVEGQIIEANDAFLRMVGFTRDELLSGGVHWRDMTPPAMCANSDVATGLGMGLSICRTIIESHGGRLWAERNEPRGARVVFELPRCLDQ